MLDLFIYFRNKIEIQILRKWPQKIQGTFCSLNMSKYIKNSKHKTIKISQKENVSFNTQNSCSTGLVLKGFCETKFQCVL